MGDWEKFDEDKLKNGHHYWIAISEQYANGEDEPIAVPHVSIGIWNDMGWWTELGGDLIVVSTVYATKPFKFIKLPRLALDLYKKDKMPYLLKNQKRVAKQSINGPKNIKQRLEKLEAL